MKKIYAQIEVPSFVLLFTDITHLKVKDQFTECATNPETMGKIHGRHKKRGREREEKTDGIVENVEYKYEGMEKQEQTDRGRWE